MAYTIDELNEKYDLQLDEVAARVKNSKSKIVCLQFPDGLKPYATSVVNYLESQTAAQFLIWLGNCFGACDTPTDLPKDVDLIIQFGHNEIMPSY